MIPETQTLYIFNEYNDLAGCTNENIFIINILGITVDEPENVIECEQYELPALTIGDYFTEPSGQGLQLNAGDIITTTQTIYVYGEKFFSVTRRPTLAGTQTKIWGWSRGGLHEPQNTKTPRLST